MDANLQAVLLFHNHQATRPNVPFTGSGTAAMQAVVPMQETIQAMQVTVLHPAAVPVQEEPPPAEPAPAPAEEEKKPNG